MANPKRNVVLRDKYKSTTAIYPKVTLKDLPTGVQPVVPEPETYTPTGEEPTAQYITIGDTVYKIEGSGGTTVVANPTLAGTENNLTGIQVGSTKYKVEQPINVVANPTLAGTESDLTGLQVGNTKYKIPNGGSSTQQQSDWNETNTSAPSYIKNKPTIIYNKQLLTTIPTEFTQFEYSIGSVVLDTPVSLDNPVEVIVDLKKTSEPAITSLIFRCVYKQEVVNNVTFYTSNYNFTWFGSSLLALQTTYKNEVLNLHLYVKLTQGADPAPSTSDFSFRVRSVKEIVNY